MEVITDPQVFETSDIVEKSSKSGVFSNQRLLVIRNGFLYYFSKVPSGYKRHIPNLLDTLKQLPKSSIQIKHIHTIKLESASSPDLIIKFYEKYMIDREQIRQSLNTQSFRRVEKPSTELEQWKFVFSSLLQCRLWYSALVKLKEYFIKQDDKIQEFFQDFDQNKRHSKLQMRKTLNLLPKAVQGHQNQSLGFILEPNMSNKQKNIAVEKEQKMVKQNKLKPIDEEEEINAKKMQEDIRGQIEQQIRQQERLKIQKKMFEMTQKLLQKQQQIDNLNEKLKREEEIKILLINSQEKLPMKELSIQTEEQIVQQDEDKKNISLSKENKQKEMINSPTKKQSAQKSQINQSKSNEKSISKLKYKQSIINKISFTESQEIHEQFTKQNYDFYQEQGLLFSKDQKFDDQINRQIQYIKYIQRMRKSSILKFIQYIDQNYPSHSITIERDKFIMQIVCSPGSIINIDGVDKLVYSNKEHQILKRQFKLYNWLHNEIIGCMKKKPNFVLRVPLCFHVEYKGYTGLLKMMPYYQDSQNQTALKSLQMIVGEEKISNFKIKEIKNRSKKIYLVVIGETYKISDVEKSLSYQGSGVQIINQCRKNLISISSVRLNKQIIMLNKNKHVRHARIWQYVKLCRHLKKVYRSSQPYTKDQNQFFLKVIQSPQSFISLSTDELNFQKTGSFISYLQYFFGFQIIGQFNNIYDELEKVQIVEHPVVRSFNNKNLASIHITDNFDKYLNQQKMDLAQTSVNFAKQIEEDKVNLDLMELKMMIKNKSYTSPIQKLNQLKYCISKHDLRFMEISALLIECYRVTNQVKLMLSQLNEALEWVTYMLGQDDEYTAYLYLFTAEILVRQNKIQDAISLYKILLNNHKNSLSKQQIFINFSNLLLTVHNADPNQLIQFMKIFLPNSTQSQSSIRIQTKIHFNVVKHLARLYKTNGNIDQAVRFYQICFNFQHQIIQIPGNISNSQQTNIFIQIGLQLLECYQNTESKLQIIRKMLTIINQISLIMNIFTQNYINLVRQLSTKFLIQSIENASYNYKGIKEIMRNEIVKFNQTNEDEFDEDIYKVKNYINVSQEQIKTIIDCLVNGKQMSKKLHKFMCLFVDISNVQSYLISS